MNNFDNKLKKIAENLQLAGLSEEEIKKLLQPIEEELDKRVCGLVWQEQTTSIPDAFNNSLPYLEKVENKSIITGKNNHLLIEGDNLYALTALQYTHIDSEGNGLVDVICIDPPYNTGNVDFSYNDKFEKSEWLSMMSIRLKLAKKIMKNDGVIFININDKYNAYLKLLCDDIFNNNFMCNMIWQKGKENGNDNTGFGKHHEYILVYGKSEESFSKILLDKKDISRHKTKLSEKNLVIEGTEIYKDGELFQLINLTKQNDYTVKIPLKSGEIIESLSYCPQETIDDYIDKGKIFVGKTKVPYVKSFLSDEKEGTPISSIINQDFGTTKAGGIEIKNIFLKKVFDYPKPSKLIKRLISLYDNPNAIVLDFFAGTGTTGHAVMQLNQEDGGNRQFILCTNNEVGKKDKVSLIKKGIAENSKEWEEYGICKAITYPRIKTIITGIRPDGSKYSDGLINNNLYYYKVNTNIEKSDFEEVNVQMVIQEFVSYISIKENIFNIKKYDNFDLLYDDNKEVIVINNYDLSEIETELIVEEYFKNIDKEKIVYCFTDEIVKKNGISYIPYPDSILKNIKAVKQYIEREV